jgi:TolB-like protein/DNA-binding winged helix-turn-helix (wHTH) protein
MQLTPGNGTAPPRFRIGDLEVDIGKAEVTRGGEKIALPKLSFDLLCALINSAPAIVTNEELLQRVWPGLIVSPESVAQRVKLLRSAIGDDSQQPRYILGVRGRGYRLIPVPERLADSGQPASDSTNPSVLSPSVTQAAGQGAAPLRRAEPRKPRGVARRVGVVAAILLALGVAVVLGWRYWSSSHKATQSVAMLDKSIAVLPFVDMSEKKDQEYFGDGMAEEIIDLLATVPAIRVIGRTSSFQFKGKTEDLRTIAEKLGVAFVLEGSVRRSGDRLRVTAQLIDSRNGSPRWSQTYDRNFSDVLNLQDEIATEVVRLVQTDAKFSEIVSHKTLRNPEAYTAFLQGIYANDRVDQQGLEQAVIDFQKALDLDPAFAEAAAALANSYVNLGMGGSMAQADAREKARLAAELALRLDPREQSAHGTLAFIHLYFDWDWPAAEREFKLAGFYPPPMAMTLGRPDDALKLLNAGLASNPLASAGYFLLGLTQLRRGQLPEAEAALRRTLELSPAYRYAHYDLGLVLLARGESEAALVEFLKESSEGTRLAGSALAYFTLGRKAESDAALAQAIKGYGAYFPSGAAAVYAIRGESDEAFKWLDRAYAQKDPLLSTIKYRTEFDKLHDDPRYKALLKKMNLPE